jgi:hypothetical protein
MDETAVAMQAIEIARLMLNQHREHYEVLYKASFRQHVNSQDRLVRVALLFLDAVDAEKREVEDEKGAH